MKKYDVLVLKSVNGDMTARFDSNFVYPKRGYVQCTKWVNNKQCGNGLHGFAWGQGSADLSHLHQKKAKWLVIGVNKKDGYSDLSNKVKFKKGYVLFCRSRSKAVEFLIANGADKSTCLFARNKNTKCKSTVVSNDYGSSISGANGISVTKNYGKSISGRDGTSIAMDNGVAISGDYGKSIIPSTGLLGKCKSGYKGLLIIGNKSFRVGESYDGILIHQDVFYRMDIYYGRIVRAK